MRVDRTPMTGALIRRGNLDTKTHRHKGDRGGDQNDASISQAMPRNARSCQKLPELGEGHRMDSPSELQEGINPVNTWILDFWPPDYERIKFCYFSHPVQGHFLQQPQEMDTDDQGSFPLIFEMMIVQNTEAHGMAQPEGSWPRGRAGMAPCMTSSQMSMRLHCFLHKVTGADRKGRHLDTIFCVYVC